MTPDNAIRELAKLALKSAKDRAESLHVYRLLSVAMPTEPERSAADRVAFDLSEADRHQTQFCELLEPQPSPNGK